MQEINDLTKHQLELKEEEDLIVSLLSRVDEQLHVLQVEQLQLLTAKIEQRLAPKTKVAVDEGKSAPMHTVIKQELDLKVPVTWNKMEEVEEEDSN